MHHLRRVGSVMAPCLFVAAVACSGAEPKNGFAEAVPTSGTASADASDEGTGTTGGFGSSTDDAGNGSSGGTTCAATSAETTKSKVDIIFVIDDSGSMNNEMEQVRANVNSFASKIGQSGLDYTVTFIVKRGTTGNAICVPPPLAGPNCADNPPLFHHVHQDVQSNDSLILILSTYEKSWKNYVRQDAVKIFIEVTDDESDISATKFDEQLLAKMPSGVFGSEAERKYIFHSIVSKPFAATPPTSARCPTSYGTSIVYQELSLLTRGLIDEVCKTDYSGVLDNIAKGIADRLGCQLSYPSSAESDPTKLTVSFTKKGAPAQTLTQVTDVSKCGAVANAWYYDDPVKPTKIVLCPSMCAQANAAADAKLEALVGCKASPPR